MKLISFFAAVCLAGLETSAQAASAIAYTLPKDGRVSLAVYDSEGRMVRTLRNAEPQKAGPQVVNWEGLDQNGQPVPAGEYTWKLLLSQGMKAEYLLSLGTSVGIDHWTAQHGGPYAVAPLPGGDVMVGASTEGAPMLVRFNPQTSRTTWVNDVWGGGGVNHIVILDGVVYTLHGAGLVRKFDAETGKQLPGELSLRLAGPELGPLVPGASSPGKVADSGVEELTDSESAPEESPAEPEAPAFNKQVASLPISATRGSFRVQGKVLFPDGGGEVKVAGESVSSKKKGEVGFTVPGKGALDANKVKKVVFQPGALAGEWSIPSVHLEGIAAGLFGGDGILAAFYPAVNQVAWLDRDGKVLASASVENAKSLAVVDAQTLLVISGTDVIEIKRDGAKKTLVAGLVAPNKIALNSADGTFFVAETGNSRQVKRFSRDGKLEATFGRVGGRKTGKYMAEDFQELSSLAADGQGGFWITEALSAPRRTAHFDANGKLLGEWLGGQQFYTWAAPDPEDANMFWMDSQWGWIMQVQVDWDKRTWKALATYAWGGNYSPELVNRYKMAQRHSVQKLDLDKDGQKETYLISDLGIQKVDEEKGSLRLVSTLGMIAANRAWEWDKFPLSKQPKVWLDAIALKGEDPAKAFKSYRGFAWADANGDFDFQPEEFRLIKKGGVEGKGGFELLADLSVLKRAGWGGDNDQGEPSWNRYPVQGFTPTGSPIWDWEKFEPFPIWTPHSPQAILFAPSGDIYQITNRGGDGYTALDTFGMGYGFAWPSNLMDKVGVSKWNAQGELKWTVGSLATQANNAPGQMHHPVQFAGLVNGTIGVCDKIVLPVAFWTEDGLYAGSLFDRRAEDGLPKRVYRWWTGGTDGFDSETGRALFQYDMILGGSLIKRPNGEVIFIGSGWNNCPAYKVTGWDEFERLEGKIQLDVPVRAISNRGTGLKAEFYANRELAGDPEFSMTAPGIWLEPIRSKKHNRPELTWPQRVARSANNKAADPLTRDSGPQDTLEELEAPPVSAKPAAAPGHSARWTGIIEPTFSEDYTFAVFRKGGQARLWIDDQLAVETKEKGNKFFSKPIALKAGQPVKIRMEWDGDPSNELHLIWQSLTQPVQHVPTRVLSPEAAEPASAASSEQPRFKSGA